MRRVLRAIGDWFVDHKVVAAFTTIGGIVAIASFIWMVASGSSATIVNNQTNNYVNGTVPPPADQEELSCPFPANGYDSSSASFIYAAVREADHQEQCTTQSYTASVAPINLTLKIKYKNQTGAQVDNVVIQVELAKGLDAIPNTTKLYNSSAQGIITSNGITTTGLNLGSYAPDGAVYVYVDVALSTKSSLKCGVNVLPIKAIVYDNIGQEQHFPSDWSGSSTAIVTALRDC